MLEIVNKRTRGHAPMLFMAENEDHIEDEEGEWLMKIENRNGHKGKSWTRVSAKGDGKGGKGPTNLECYRCGRPGHIRKDCRARKHMNGGEPKEFRKKGLNNLEPNDDEEMLGDLGGMDLDICMLEESTKVKYQTNPFGTDRYDPSMPNPFMKAIAESSERPRNDRSLFGGNFKNKDGTTEIENDKDMDQKEGAECDDHSLSVTALEGSTAKKYSARALQDICKKASNKICEQVKASLELISENIVEEMRTEIDSQQVFQFNVVAGWQPIEKFEDCGEHDEVAQKSEDKSFDIMAFDDKDVDNGEWENMEVTVDSGAAHSVADGNTWPTIPRRESEGSKNGSYYLGPGKERIPNRGQKSLSIKTEGNKNIRRMTFQDAEVRKPLAAVSGITEKDNVVLFDRKGSFIAPANCPEVKTIRELIRQVKNRIELECKKGVYVMPIWVQTAVGRMNKDKQSGFIGQGK